MFSARLPTIFIARASALNIFVCQQPETIINQQQALLQASTDDAATFAIEFYFEQYYWAKPQDIALLALIYLEKTPASISVSAAILVSEPAVAAAVKNLSANNLQKSDLLDFAHRYGVPWLDLSVPLTLDPVKIAKPWGQEIWYTGIEARGQSNVIAQGLLTPLPWVLALMPVYLAAGKSKKIILLKTLDPLPDEVYGDLYFELHEQKQEVYVVTHIDPQAWPDNTGEIRLGFCREKLSQFANEEAFKSAYLAAVSEYEIIRRKIDSLLDLESLNIGITLDAPVAMARRSSLLAVVPEELRQQEQQSRAYMNSFSATVRLRMGDVVKIPCHVPHALQHGVRTIELQTPVYERKILSFAQKVLTQSHWDTHAAMEKVDLAVPRQEELRILSEEEGVLVEEVVKFDDFRVIRIHFTAVQEYLIKPQNSYALILPIGGDCTLISGDNKLEIAAETAVFVPQQLLANAKQLLRLSVENTSVQVLLADVVV